FTTGQSLKFALGTARGHLPFLGQAAQNGPGRMQGQPHPARKLQARDAEEDDAEGEDGDEDERNAA
ncbi:MAG: hypothetical protein ACK6A4_05150, partial [Alphaproteobacteria bacterium]